MSRTFARISTIVIISLAVIALAATIDVIRLKHIYAEYYSSPDKVGEKYWLLKKDGYVTDGTIPRQLPGPLDVWAGAESKSIVIPLHSVRPLRMEIHLLDSHDAHPPSIRVISGDREQSFQVKPGKGTPPHLWQKEGRRSLEVVELDGTKLDPRNISISSTSGSWAVIERIVIQLKPYPWEPKIAFGSWLALALVCGVILLRNRGQGASHFQKCAGDHLKILLNDDTAPADKYPVTISILVFTIFFLGAHYKLVRGWNIPVWDAYEYFLPYYILVADYIRAGKILLWNPYGAGGIPAFIDPQVGAFSPLTLLFAFITGGTYLGFNAYWLFLLWLGGAGIILLACQYDAPPWGGIAAALGFVFSGYHIGHSEHTPVLYAFAFLPLIIYMLETSFDNLSYMRVAIAGGLFGVAGLGGYPGVILMMGGYLAAWMAVRMWDPDRSHRRVSLRFYLKAMSLFFILSGIIMAPVYLGFLIEGAGYTARTGYLPRSVAISSNALHPAALGSFTSPVFPVVKHNVGNSTLWAYNDLSSFSIYLCPIVFLFGILSVTFNPRSISRWWILGLGVLAIAFSMGESLPFRGWLYDLVIPTRYFRHPSWIRGFYIFSITVLSLYAFKDISGLLKNPAIVIARSDSDEAISQTNNQIVRDRHGRQRLPRDDNSRVLQQPVKLFFMGTTAITITAVIVYPYLMYGAVGSVIATGYTTANIHFVWAWLVAMCVVIMIYRWPDKARQTLPLALLSIAAIDAFINVRVSGGIVSREVAAINPHYYQAHNSSLDLTENKLKLEWGDSRNSNFSAKEPGMISYGPVTYSNNVYMSLLTEPIAKDNLTGKPRIWFSNNPYSICPNGDEYERIKDIEGFWPLFQNVIHDRGAMLGDYSECGSLKDMNLTSGVSKEINATLQSHTPRHVMFTVIAPDDGYVTIGERWARSWKAKVNNVEAPVLGGSFIFRSVKVSKGANEIEMIYEPGYALWALAFSYSILAGVLVLAIGRRRAFTAP